MSLIQSSRQSNTFKVILVRPPDPRGKIDILSHSPPMNLAYLAAYLMQDDYQVEIWDYDTKKYHALDFIKRINQAKPKIIGFGCMTPTIKLGNQMARVVKENFSDILTLVGGPHSSAWPQRTLKDFPFFDVVVIGEGEETLLKFCQAVKENKSLTGILGLAYQNQQGIQEEERRPLIENLDKLPFPRRDLLDLHSIRRGHVTRGISSRLRSTEIFTSRGCPIGCIFCAIGVTMGLRARFRSPANVLTEVEECIKQFDFEHFVINDDTFTLNPGRAIEIMKGMKAIGVKSWHCEGTRVNAVSPEILKIMAQTGCQKVVFGVESGSPRILELIGKKITISQIKNAFKWAREAGIRFVEGNYIIGSHPSETEEDLQMTIDLIKATKPDLISASIIVPYPGTRIYEIMKEKSYILTEDWEKFVMIDQLPSWRTEHFTPAELLQLQRKILRNFYLRPGYILRTLRRMKNIKEIRYWSEAGWEFIKWLGRGRLT